ncbi:hypothetical protein HYW35_03745 [Candidatus Saccharibacteria bacterium]|nr:hypothetical protein [Candidatus Saccharibacteria bacterium]
MARIQFNLLPDVKLQFDKAKRVQNLVFRVATAASATMLGLFLVMLVVVHVVQKSQLSSAAKAQDTLSSQLSNIPNLGQIITIQNQLKTLVGLHQAKHVSSRIFTYLPQVTPSNASIGKLDIDLAGSTMSISGNADSQKTVNTFIDTLKFTTYMVGDQDTPHSAFTSVVESTFAINATNVSYTLDISFDPQLFANNLLDSQDHPQEPKLSVPKLTTTKSGVNDANNPIFKTQSGGGQ